MSFQCKLINFFIFLTFVNVFCVLLSYYYNFTTGQADSDFNHLNRLFNLEFRLKRSDRSQDDLFNDTATRFINHLYDNFYFEANSVERKLLELPGQARSSINPLILESRQNLEPDESLAAEDWTCPFDLHSKSSSQQDSHQPLHNVRKTHYLLNLSPFGPNNQFRGFRDSLMLSIYLNRTLVLPLFFKHNSDPAYDFNNMYNNIQPADQRVDVEILKRYTRVITIEELNQQGCSANTPKKFDFILFARKSFGDGPFEQLKVYEAYSRNNSQNYELGFNFTNQMSLSSHIISKYENMQG